MGLSIVGASVFLAVWAKKWIRLNRVNKSRWAGFLWGIRFLAVCIPVLLVWFVAFWGAGYRRLPVTERLHLDTSSVSDREAGSLQGLLLELVKRDLALVRKRDPAHAVQSIASAMERIVAEWDGRGIRLPCRVKSVPKGFLLSNGTSGVCAPFTLEALADRGLPDTAFVYSSAHELGHIAGFCPEDEASFAGYFSGLQAEDPFARYACALNAYLDLISGLKSDEFKKALRNLPEPARRDLKNADEAYRRYRIRWFNRISQLAYGRYLKTQGIKEGVENYSHGITLLAYAWRKGMLSHYLQ